MENNPLNLTQFLDQLERFEQNISSKELEEHLKALTFSDEELKRFQCFESSRYVRNLIYRGVHFEVLLLCFEAGQRTPIHDHAGSACGVKIIRGTGMESVYGATDDHWIYPIGTSELNAGDVLSSNDSDTHQLSNLQADGKQLVTLHVYSPPLVLVGNYSITDNTVTHVSAPTNDRTNELVNDLADQRIDQPAVVS